MFKVLWLLKRKPGITFEQFRDHYENSHAVLGQKYLGHLMVAYKRNYDMGNAAGAEARPKASGYDCITEWVMPDARAFEESMRLLADPVIGKIFHDDEEHFLERESVRLVRCDCRDTGPGDGSETLKLVQPHTASLRSAPSTYTSNPCRDEGWGEGSFAQIAYSR